MMFKTQSLPCIPAGGKITIAPPESAQNWTPIGAEVHTEKGVQFLVPPQGLAQNLLSAMNRDGVQYHKILSTLMFGFNPENPFLSGLQAPLSIPAHHICPDVTSLSIPYTLIVHYHHD